MSSAIILRAIKNVNKKRNEALEKDKVLTVLHSQISCNTKTLRGQNQKRLETNSVTNTVIKIMERKLASHF